MVECRLSTVPDYVLSQRSCTAAGIHFCRYGWWDIHPENHTTTVAFVSLHHWNQRHGLRILWAGKYAFGRSHGYISLGTNPDDRIHMLVYQLHLPVFIEYL